MKILNFKQWGRVLSLLLCLSYGASADPLQEARQMIQNISDRAIQDILSAQRPLKEREVIVRELLRASFDLPSIARFTLGSYWRQMSSLQKEEFKKLFEDVVVHIYTQRFEGYESAQVVVLDAIQEGKNIKVLSEIQMPERPSLKVGWKVCETSQGPKILDVFVDGISMSITQRSEFGNLIQQNGGSLDHFMNTLRQRIKD